MFIAQLYKFFMVLNESVHFVQFEHTFMQ